MACDSVYESVPRYHAGEIDIVSKLKLEPSLVNHIPTKNVFNLCGNCCVTILNCDINFECDMN